jgi:hypothetical protein
MSMGPNPYAAGSPGVPGGALPPEVASKANNMQIMGIASIPVGLCCCPLIGVVLSIMVLAQAGGVAATLAQYGNPPELVSKVSTGKTCAIIGIVCSALNMIGGIAINLSGLLNQPMPQ